MIEKSSNHPHNHLIWSKTIDLEMHFINLPIARFSNLIQKPLRREFNHQTLSLVITFQLIYVSVVLIQLKSNHHI